MYIPCVDPFGHDPDLAACEDCDVIICTTCNGPTCGNGCGVRKSVKRKRSINLHDRNEVDLYDSLRVIVGTRFYAFLRDIEQEASNGLLMHHLVFECIEAAWFDHLDDDLANMPSWQTVAHAATFCIADIVIVEEYLTEVLTSSLSGEVTYARGNWVQMWMDPNQPVVPWVEALLCLPGSSNSPVLTACSGVLQPGYVTRFERVRPGMSGLQKLRRLETLT